MIAVAALTGCSGGNQAAEQPAPVTVTTPSSTPSSTPSVTPSVMPPPVDPVCTPGPGRTVKELPDLQVPAVTVAPLKSGDRTVMDGFTVPAQVIDAGCVVQYDAPGGCLGAIKISGAAIPPVTIPESRVEGRVFAAVTIAGAQAPAVDSPQVCQVEKDGELPTVTRKGVVRREVSRNGGARPGGSADGVAVETVKLEPVRLPGVDVDPARLESRKLPGQDKVDVFTGEGKISYVAPGDVLFDTDQAAIRPDAARALHAIAVKIKAANARPLLRVEGHTDDRGDATYGLRLSERRAQAVATWLIRNEGFAGNTITTKGFGETAPAVPNTSAANRQLNRRVVITVAAR
ncbi:OmpA family protein [Kribbella sp. NPDC051770]|uniref:OmpA family protein n=1 Tax=Kribbella sp. NPDC051770 TaxID=3155413 RepID=UPI00341B1926